MKSADRTYEFRCPVHGFIRVNDQEREIIEQPAFQRLRHIRQLAWTEMIYPGAVHTRFEHSLGVLHVATLLFDALVRHSKETLKSELGYDDAGLARYRSLVRLVALLHDVGHGPFSHAAEELTPLRPDGSGKYLHEEYSAGIIRTYFKDIIENHQANKNHGFSAENVAVLLEGKAEAKDALFWRGLISGQLDADRMDYLLRDSLHAGVDYGRYDLNRLISTMEVIPSTDSTPVQIGINNGGVHAAEALILARYFMFTQVYFHKTRVIYNYHLEEALRAILPGGVLPSPAPETLEEYLQWDDWKVFGALSSGEGGEHGKILRTREHYRRVFETDEVPSILGDDRLSQARALLETLNVVEKTAGKSWYKTASEDIAVRQNDGRIRPLSEHSNVVKELKPSRQTLLYVPPNQREEARRLLKSKGL